VHRRSSAIQLQDDWLQLPCVCANLRRVARLATRIYDEELRPVGMEVGQFGLTATIARLGPITQIQLARGLAMDQTSLTRTLGVLQKRGWIQKRVGEDRRSREFVATDAGRAQLDLARPCWRRGQQRLAAAIGQDRIEHLGDVVDQAALALAREARR
jgi:DNA-binding MarR family transcriptional regulator